MALKEEFAVTPLGGSAIHMLHRVGQCAGDLFAEEVTGEGLTPRQFAVLVAIASNEGLSQTDLVERTGVDRSTLADIVRRLLKKGLINRRRTKSDARAYSVRLSDKGRSALNAARPAVQRAEERLLSALGPTDRDEFMAALDRILRTIASES